MSISSYQNRPHNFVETELVDTIESDFYKSLMPLLRASKTNEAENSDDYSLLKHFCDSMNISRSTVHSTFVHPLMILGFVPLSPGLTPEKMAMEISTRLAKENPERGRLNDLARKHFGNVKGIDLITPLEKNLCEWSDALTILRINKNMTQEAAEQVCRNSGNEIHNRLIKWEKGVVPSVKKSVDPLFSIYGPSGKNGKEQELYDQTCMLIKRGILEKSDFRFGESDEIGFSNAIRNLTLLSEYYVLNQPKAVTWIYRDQKPEDKKTLLKFIKDCAPKAIELEDLELYELHDQALYEEQKINALKIYSRERRNELGYCDADVKSITVGDSIRNLWIISGRNQKEILKEISRTSSTFSKWMSNEDNPESKEVVQKYVEVCRPSRDDLSEEHKRYEEQKNALLGHYVENNRKIKYKYDADKPSLNDLMRNMFLLSGYTRTTINDLTKKCDLKGTQIEYWLYGKNEAIGRTGMPESREDLTKFIKGCEPPSKQTKKKELYDHLKVVLMQEYNAWKRKENGYCEKSSIKIELHEAIANVAILSDLSDEKLSKQSKIPKGTFLKWYSGGLADTEEKLTKFLDACKPVDEFDGKTMVLYKEGYINALNKYRDRRNDIRKEVMQKRKKTDYVEKSDAEITINEALKNIYILSSLSMSEITANSKKHKSGLVITKSSMDRWFVNDLPSKEQKLVTYLDVCNPGEDADKETLELYAKNKTFILNQYPQQHDAIVKARVQARKNSGNKGSGPDAPPNYPKVA